MEEDTKSDRNRGMQEAGLQALERGNQGLASGLGEEGAQCDHVCVFLGHMCSEYGQHMRGHTMHMGVIRSHLGLVAWTTQRTDMAGAASCTCVGVCVCTCLHVCEYLCMCALISVYMCVHVHAPCT